MTKMCRETPGEVVYIECGINGMSPFYSSSHSCLKWEDEGRLGKEVLQIEYLVLTSRGNTGFVCSHILAIRLGEPRAYLCIFPIKCGQPFPR